MEVYSDKEIQSNIEDKIYTNNFEVTVLVSCDSQLPKGAVMQVHLHAMQSFSKDILEKKIEDQFLDNDMIVNAKYIDTHIRH